MMKDKKPLAWSDYWKELGIFNAVSEMQQLGVPPSSLHAVYELDNDAAVHAFFDEAKEKSDELDARVVTAVHLYYLTRHGAEPVKLSDVLPGPDKATECPLWWNRLIKKGITSYWFDIVSELSSRKFKRSVKPSDRRLYRDASSGKLMPQGVFLTVLDGQTGEALVSVCSVVNGKSIVMTAKILQGKIGYWAPEVRTTANALIHAAVASAGADLDEQDVQAYNIMAATLGMQ